MKTLTYFNAMECAQYDAKMALYARKKGHFGILGADDAEARIYQRRTRQIRKLSHVIRRALGETDLPKLCVICGGPDGEGSIHDKCRGVA